jgi:hypothetical protein
MSKDDSRERVNAVTISRPRYRGTGTWTDCRVSLSTGRRICTSIRSGRSRPGSQHRRPSRIGNTRQPRPHLAGTSRRRSYSRINFRLATHIASDIGSRRSRLRLTDSAAPSSVTTWCALRRSPRYRCNIRSRSAPSRHAVRFGCNCTACIIAIGTKRGAVRNLFQHLAFSRYKGAFTETEQHRNPEENQQGDALTKTPHCIARI